MASSYTHSPQKLSSLGLNLRIIFRWHMILYLRAFESKMWSVHGCLTVHTCAQFGWNPFSGSQVMAITKNKRWRTDGQQENTMPPSFSCKDIKVTSLHGLYSIVLFWFRPIKGHIMETWATSSKATNYGEMVVNAQGKHTSWQICRFASLLFPPENKAYGSC